MKKTSKLKSLFLSSVFLISFPVSDAYASRTQAKSAQDFIDSIGVNTHMTAPTGPSNNINLIAGELSYTHITHVRDSLFTANSLDELRTLNAWQNTRFDLVYDYYGDGTTQLLNDAIKNVDKISSAIETIEGPNEPDQFEVKYNGTTGRLAIYTLQKNLYQNVKNDVYLSKPVLCPAMSNPLDGEYSRGLNQMYCDVSAAHDYVHYRSDRGLQLIYDYIKDWSGYATWMVGNPTTIPKMITEGGWRTMFNDSDSVDEQAQGKYTLEYLLDAFSQGITRTYLYQLSDGPEDPSGVNMNLHWGIFKSDGSPKIAAWAIANTNRLLSGSNIQHAQYLDYNVSGLPASGHQLLLQKSDGVFILALWNEGQLWDSLRQVDIPMANINVTLSIPGGPSQISVFDPYGGDSKAYLSLNNVTSANLTIPDHPILIMIQHSSFEADRGRRGGVKH